MTHGRKNRIQTFSVQLQPFQDTTAGEIDTWPAHATEQGQTGVSAALTQSKHLVLRDDEAMGKPQTVPKPGFLAQLENFLKRELKSLGVSKVEASELRLQVGNLKDAES